MTGEGRTLTLSHKEANRDSTPTKINCAMMEATSTLADALLDDLDDLSDVEENNNLQEEQEAKKIGENGGKSNEATTNDVASFSRRRLLDDPSLQAHLEAVRKCDSSKPSSDRKQQEEMEHQLVVQSNKHLANLANEMARAHGDLCAAYKPKFPELEELVVDPIKYKSAVRVIGNEMDMTKSHVNDGLNEFLSSNQIITISVSSSTSTGRPLTPEELNTVDQAATYMEEISKVQQELTRFVESRMESLAPSVCVLIGPTVAANMLGLAGGLAELSRIPACNLQVLGQVKQNAASRAGLSSNATKPHTGILADCELVKSVPSYLQKKALKVVAAKLALVARFDYTNVDTGRTRSDSAGRRFREEIETKIASWQTQDKAPVLKALPKYVLSKTLLNIQY
jgi:U4/U6 small nuclear ribonucleoprotein PRP31